MSKNVRKIRSKNPKIVAKASKLKSSKKLNILVALVATVVVFVAGFMILTSKAAATWPETPPAQICGNNAILGGGPTSAPAGAIVVPAGDNSNINFQQDNKTYWFASGVHTLGTDQYSQIAPGDNSTFVGAPGAILDGQNLNNYAFTQKSTGVTIRYLTIRNFKAPRDEGVVNHDAATGWTIEYSTITNNKGAGLMVGSNNLYRYNCMKDNGQYAINGCCGGDTAATDIQNWTLDHNEITGNNTDDWESQVEGCGCTGGVKFWLNKNVTVTNNWVHHNKGAGFWLDNNNSGFIIENNYINDNDAQAIFTEAGYDARIRYNNIKNNAIVEGKIFAARGDPFPIGAIYVSEAGSPAGYGLLTHPMVISNNNFENNWGGINLWENADRYSGSSAHTHVSGTIKMGNLYDDAECDGASDTIPLSVADKYDCRWSTENVIVENNTFSIDKATLGTGCVGTDYCGINGIFANVGTYPEFSGYEIPWKITFQQGNIFRNNTYTGDWKFAGFQTTRQDGSRVPWGNWTAAAPSVPNDFQGDPHPATFGQDVGSTLNGVLAGSVPPDGGSGGGSGGGGGGAGGGNGGTKTFEDDTEDIAPWFSASVARTTAISHGGSASLAITGTGGNWGLEESWPGELGVTAGEEYEISAWVRSATTSRTITMSVIWHDSTEAVTGTTDSAAAANNSSGWTKISTTVTAPTGARLAQFRFASNGGTNGEIHYLDDIAITPTTPPEEEEPPVSSGKVGDLNNDGNINVLDMSILLTNWNKSTAQLSTPKADINSDGTVNVIDLSQLLTKWGT
jgi:parallel beta-helix repeat protein